MLEFKKSRLYCFTPGKFANGRDIIKITEDEIIGGADIIQLREKNMSDSQKLELAIKLREITKKYKKFFIVNDDVDIAYLSDADGVHLGQNDIPPFYARKILKDKIIGISTHNLEQYIKAQDMDVDYVAIGPIFKTFSKDNPDPVIGIENLKKIIKYKKKMTVGIGGIKENNLKDVIEAGVDCVAILSGIVEQNDVKYATKYYKDLILNFYKE